MKLGGGWSECAGSAARQDKRAAFEKKPPEGSGGLFSQEQCLVRPAASAAEIRLVACLITTHVLILISVLVSIRPVISTVRVVAIPRIRIERFVLRYVPASLV